jgi:hypothetical protein
MEVRKLFDKGQSNAVTGIAPGGVDPTTLTTQSRSDVYFRPAVWFSSRGINPRTMFHEALHSITGLGDELLAKKLGLNVPETQSPSAAISKALKDNDCVR